MSTWNGTGVSPKILCAIFIPANVFVSKWRLETNTEWWRQSINRIFRTMTSSMTSSATYDFNESRVHSIWIESWSGTMHANRARGHPEWTQWNLAPWCINPKWPRQGVIERGPDFSAASHHQYHHHHHHHHLFKTSAFFHAILSGVLRIPCRSQFFYGH